MTQLSFVWAGNLQESIEVCHGGYGEDVIDTIDPQHHVQENFMPTASGWLHWFEMACVAYIITHMRGEGDGQQSG